MATATRPGAKRTSWSMVWEDSERRFRRDSITEVAEPWFFVRIYNCMMVSAKPTSVGLWSNKGRIFLRPSFPSSF